MFILLISFGFKQIIFTSIKIYLSAYIKHLLYMGASWKGVLLACFICFAHNEKCLTCSLQDINRQRGKMVFCRLYASLYMLYHLLLPKMMDVGKPAPSCDAVVCPCSWTLWPFTMCGHMGGASISAAHSYEWGSEACGGTRRSGMSG